MRIISKFHDYYDSVMSQGQDFGLLYLRNEEKKNLPLSKWPGRFPHCRASSKYATRYHDTPHLGIEDYIVGFCGKIYPVIYLEADAQIAGQIAKSDGSKVLYSTFCYSLAEIDAFIEKHYKKKHIEAYYDNKYSWRSKNWPYYARRGDFKELFDECARKIDQYTDIFMEHHSPIFIVKNGSQLVINASLKQYEFYKKFDSYTAFQELQMFLGNQASPEKPIPHVSDRDLMEGKGFDYKWSFRKEKEK